MNPKTPWRATLLAKRKQLDREFVEEASLRIKGHLLSLEEFRLSERIGLYAAFNNEVETKGVFSKAHVLRKEIFYPAVHLENKALFYYRVRSLEELKPGYAGILEPRKTTHPLGSINFLNLILIPGIAFDRLGNRLGFGQGYYDRLLKHFSGKRVALAFDFQIVESLPAQPRDQRVDIIVTEERVLRII